MSLNDMQNSRVKHKAGVGSLPTAESGSLIFSTDTGKIYLDTPDGRIEMMYDSAHSILVDRNDNSSSEGTINSSSAENISEFMNGTKKLSNLIIKELNPEQGSSDYTRYTVYDYTLSTNISIYQVPLDILEFTRYDPNNNRMYASFVAMATRDQATQMITNSGGKLTDFNDLTAYVISIICPSGFTFDSSNSRSYNSGSYVVYCPAYYKEMSSSSGGGGSEYDHTVDIVLDCSTDLSGSRDYSAPYGRFIKKNGYEITSVNNQTGYSNICSQLDTLIGYIENGDSVQVKLHRDNFAIGYIESVDFDLLLPFATSDKVGSVVTGTDTSTYSNLFCTVDSVEGSYTLSYFHYESEDGSGGGFSGLYNSPSDTSFMTMIASDLITSSDGTTFVIDDTNGRFIEQSGGTVKRLGSVYDLLTESNLESQSIRICKELPGSSYTVYAPCTLASYETNSDSTNLDSQNNPRQYRNIVLKFEANLQEYVTVIRVYQPDNSGYIYTVDSDYNEYNLNDCEIFILKENIPLDQYYSLYFSDSHVSEGSDYLSFSLFTTDPFHRSDTSSQLRAIYYSSAYLHTFLGIHTTSTIHAVYNSGVRSLCMLPAYHDTNDVIYRSEIFSTDSIVDTNYRNFINTTYGSPDYIYAQFRVQREVGTGLDGGESTYRYKGYFTIVPYGDGSGGTGDSGDFIITANLTTPQSSELPGVSNLSATGAQIAAAIAADKDIRIVATKVVDSTTVYRISLQYAYSDSTGSSPVHYFNGVVDFGDGDKYLCTLSTLGSDGASGTTTISYSRKIQPSEIDSINSNISSLQTSVAGKMNNRTVDDTPNTNHTDNLITSAGVASAVQNVLEVAQGKTVTRTFDTKSALDTWITNNSTVTNSMRTVTDPVSHITVKHGDIFLIIATDVPDYWWDNQTLQDSETVYGNLRELEARSMDLGEYVRTRDLNTTLENYALSSSVPHNAYELSDHASLVGYYSTVINDATEFSAATSSGGAVATLLSHYGMVIVKSKVAPPAGTSSSIITILVE